MKRRPKVASLLFYGLVTIMVATSVTSFIAALSWLNKPFPGFLVYEEAFVGSFKSSEWPGMKAGLKFLDRIAAVDGKPVLEGQDVLNMVRQKAPGTPVRYIVKSKGGVREVTVPVEVFTVKDFLLVFLVVFLGGSIIYVFGITVYLLKPNMRVSWIFLLESLWLGSYMVSGFEVQSSYILARFNYSCVPLITGTLFHLFLIFPDRKRVLTRWPLLEYLIYVPALIIVLGCQIYSSMFREASTSDLFSWLLTYAGLGKIVRAFAFICVIGFIAFVFHALFRADTTQARQRARVILFGVTVAFAPPIMVQVLAFLIKFGFAWNFFPFFIIFFPASIAYSIVKHNLFDADAIIKRTVGYVVVTCIIVGAYVGVSVTLNLVIGKYELAQSRTFPILFTLGVILVFNPLRNRIQALVDRVFFRKDYDYGEIAEKVGGAMTSLLDLPLILGRLVQTFIEDMFISTSSVMLLAPAGTEFQVFLAEGEQKQIVEKVALKQDNPLMEIIRKEKRELTKYDVLEDPRYRAISESCAADFASLNASLIVPLVYQNQVIGSLNLGEKKSGKAYNREDIELLRTIANQGAIAIENARLFQENLEKQRMEEELNIARDLQMSMLPAACPEMKGFKIAASSSPAKEVGGDFFDFIEMGRDRVGLVVGDVTGNSVSGALVMSASRSVFRMLSEEKLTVGDIMTRANKRIKKDIKSGMFVALLYAVLDGRNKILRFCSAGQTQPIHLSKKTGKANLTTTEGDKFPLGILDEAEYMETILQLEGGDRVVFYTDGIVEAMNEQKEIFGFERLLEVVQGAPSLSAELLLKEILERVKKFAGGAEQHDDLTLVVVTVLE
jgi:sigma-B regulation protein RsbU (phosphoserine phosphatase)